MAKALPIGEDDGYSSFVPDLDYTPEEGIGVGDYGRAVASGAYGVVGALAGAGQYLAGSGESAPVASVRRWAEEGARGQVEQMSPRAQRALSAGVLPSEGEADIWDENVSAGGALGLKVAASVPSLVASLLPGALVGRVALSAGASARVAGRAAGTAGGASAGAQSGGDVFSDIQQAILEEPDEALQRDSEVYRGLRAMGVDEGTAKQQIIEEAAGFKPLYMAAITALTSRYGVEGLMAKGIAGQGARGVLTGIGRGALGESVQEGIEGASQEIITQYGAADARRMDPHLDWYKALEAAAQGMAVGAVTGGAFGGATARGAPRPATADLDPAVIAATQPEAVTPEVTPERDLVAELEDIPNTIEVPPGVAAPAVPGATAPAVAPPPLAPAPVPAGDVDPAVLAALSPTVTEEGWEDPDAPDVPPMPVGTPVVTPQVARVIGSAGVGQPLPEPVNTAADLRRIGDMGAGITDSMYDAMLAKVEAGDTTEAGAPSAILQAAKLIKDNGGVVDRDTLKTMGAEYVALKERAPSGPEFQAGMQDIVARNFKRAAQPVPSPEVPATTLPAEPETLPVAAPVASEAIQEDIPEVAAEPPVTPEVTGPRVLKNVKDKTADDTYAMVERDGKMTVERVPAAERQRKGPRLSKKMQEQVDAGKVPLPAKEAAKRDRAEALTRVAARTRQAMEDMTYDPAAMQDDRKAMLAYVKALAATADPEVSLKNIKTDADPAVQLLAKAKSVAGTPTTEKLRDFMTNDMDVRRGGALIAEYRRAQTASKTSTATEAAGSEGISAPGGRPITEGAVRDEGTEATERSAYDVVRKRNPRVLPDRVRAAREMRRSRTGQVASAADVKAADESTGKFAVAENRAGTFKIETKARRVLKKPGTAASAPLAVASAADVAKATAHVSEPTPAQAAAENYPKGHLIYNGMPITVETPKGGWRRGVGRDGKPWQVKLTAPYGYIKKTIGADGDHLDAYLGDNPESNRVFVVDQVDADTKKFDEHKALIGFLTPEAALKAYRGGFSDGRADERIGGITEMTREQFKQLVQNPVKTPLATKASQLKLKMDVKRALVQKTATTEIEAEVELKEDIVRDNQDALSDEQEAATPEGNADILPMLSDEDILTIGDENLAVEMFLARERAQEGPRYRRETTLRRVVKENPIPGEIGGVNRLMIAQVRERIMKLAGDVPVVILDRASFFEASILDMQRRGDFRLPNGYYDPNTDTIYLLDEKVSNRLIAHEGAHAVYEHALMARPEVRRHINALMEPVREQFLREADADGRAAVELPYGLTNSSEFIAEAFSNPEFQDLLARTTIPTNARVPYRTQGLSVWTSFLRQLGELLWPNRKGFRPETALEQIVKVAQELDTQIGRERNSGPMLQSMGAGPLVNVKNELANIAADSGVTDDYNFRRVGLVAATFNTIQKNFDSLFEGSPLKRIQRAMDDMRQTAQGVAEEARRHAESWLRLEHSDYQEARRAAQMAIALTTANMNPVNRAGATPEMLLAANPHLNNNRLASYQGRQKLVQLNADFMALKPSTRDLVTSSGNFFRDTQNQLAQASVDKLLDLAKAPLTAQQRADLRSKTTRGRLDEDDKKLIGDDTLFKAMQHATELRVIDGIYFPLMRHGNYVVTTRDRIPDLHGGTMVDGQQDVIEWRAADKKAAEALYQRFAKDPNSPRVTSVGLVRFERSTGKQISAADAKGIDHDIALRARVQTRGVYFFETQRAANRFIRESKASGQFDFVAPKFLKRNEAFRSGELTTQQMQAILNTVDRRDDLAEGTKKMLHAVLKEASIRQLSGNRIQQRSLPRRGIKGASEEVARNIVMYGQAAGNYYARIKHMDDVRKPLEEMNALNKREPASKDRQAREQVIDEVESRVLTAASQDDMQLPRWVQDAFVLSYLYRLFSPAYSIINGMQPWMVTAPVLGGRYGFMRTGAAMSRAYYSIGGPSMIGSGLANTGRAAMGVGPRSVTINTTDIVQSMKDNLAKESDGKRLLEVIDEAVSRGKIDPNSGQEIAAAVGTGAGGARKALARFDRIARQLPQAVEAVNRSVTLVAAYRLHYASTGNHQESLEQAFDAMMSTQGDYSVQNNPRFFNHPLLKPALQFKKFALMMGNLLVDLTRRALGRNPSRADRMAALKSLGGIIGVQMLMAGALGLPGLEILKVGALVAAALGLGDGWEDIERQLRTALDRNVGKDWGEMLTTGVVGKLIDVDLSKRLSLSDMALYGEPESYDKEGVQSFVAQFILGAPGSMLFDWQKGIQQAGEGEWLKAASTMIPVKIVSDIAKATRGYGNRDMTTGDAVRQVVGFRSRSLAEEGYQTGVRIADTKKATEKAKELKRAYINAGSKAELMKLRAQIIAHNKKMDAAKLGLRQKVTISSLDRIRAQNEARRKARQGDSYSPAP